jgi:hypothetical protein
LAGAVVTVETERIKRSNPWRLWRWRDNTLWQLIANVSGEPAASSSSFFPSYPIDTCGTLLWNAGNSYHTTWCHTADDSNMHIHCSESHYFTQLYSSVMHARVPKCILCDKLWF